jgi:hypothetical protein
MIGSGEENIGDSESRRKRVRRPFRFWVRDIKHGNVVNKAGVMLYCAADANVDIDAETVYACVPMQVIIWC